MTTKRMKDDTVMAVDQQPVLEDRISELPNDVLLDIVSRLPTIVAVRMSLLSRRWRHVWMSVPVIDIEGNRDVTYFRQLNKKRIGRNKLAVFMNKCLSCYPFPNNPVSTFKFQSGIVWCWDGMLRYPVLKDVKELELEASYALPRFVLDLKGLTRMTLSSVVLNTPIPANLPLLNELSLKFVTLGDQTVNNLLSGCTSLEKLTLYCCHGFANPEFSSSSLKQMVFSMQSYASHPIRVNGASLQSFVYDGGYQDNSKNCADLVRCPAIRDISLTRACLENRWFENCIPKLTVLERLKLTNCFGMQHAKIYSPCLKSFVFDSKERLDSLEATIDAPCLEHFSYSGASLFGISVCSQNLVKADIRIHERRRKTYNREWYTSLIKFLAGFNSCEAVHMFFPSKLALIVPDESRETNDQPCPDLKYLELKTPDKALHRKKMLRNSLSWIAPSLETLKIEQEEVNQHRRTKRRLPST